MPEPGTGTDFLQPDAKRDFALMVEDTKVYVNTDYLAYWSPVFENIFYPEGAPFKQPDGDVGMLIVMKEKKLDEFLLFLQAIFPTSCIMKIDETNLTTLLAYADEYGVEVLRERCVEFLSGRLKEGSVGATDLIAYLRLASLYNLADLQTTLIPLVGKLPFCEILRAHETLPFAVLAAVYQSKALRATGSCQSELPTDAFKCWRCSATCAISTGWSACCHCGVFVSASATADALQHCEFKCFRCSNACTLKLKSGRSAEEKCSACCEMDVRVYPKCDGSSAQLNSVGFSADLLQRKDI